MTIPLVLRQLWWFFLDIWNVSYQEKDLFIDLRRVNAEDCALMRRALEEDVTYRAKVVRRVLEGEEAKDLKPLIDREKVLRSRKAKPKNVVPIVPKQARG